MKTIKIGNKEYKIKYGYLATTKSKIIKELANLDTGGNDGNDGNEFELLDAVLGFLPKMLLVGLQKFHKDEYGCDFSDTVGTKAATEKVCDLLDEYFDSEDSDMQELFMTLQNELVENGFLSNKAQRQAQAANNTATMPTQAQSEN